MIIAMKKILSLILLVVLVSGVTAFTVVKVADSHYESASYKNETLPVQKVSFSGDAFPDFTYAAETAVKGVVHVKVVKRGVSEQYSIYDFFFGYAPQRVPREQMGAGSGVIITSDGYIVTNNHVIEGADEITVTTGDNKSYKAKLVGADRVTDVALIKIDDTNLPYLTFGSSDSLRLGEWVLAIGNPYNLRSTVTAGIVSAKARTITDMDGGFKIEAFIQTDAAVNSGNSGGALVNTKGELVGINTAIASRTGSYDGYSFAIPSTIVKKVVEDFIKFGSIKRAMLGVTFSEDPAEKGSRGVSIDGVLKGGAAETAGIRKNDVVLSINGIDVNSITELKEQISRFRPGDKIRVLLIRDKKEKEFIATLQKYDDGETVMPEGEEGIINFLGAKIRNATDSILRKAGARYGVEVVSSGEGKLKKAGIKEGFIITHINQVPVRTIQELTSLFRSSTRSVLIEGVYPDGTVMYYGMGI